MDQMDHLMNSQTTTATSTMIHNDSDYRVMIGSSSTENSVILNDKQPTSTISSTNKVESESEECINSNNLVCCSSTISIADTMNKNVNTNVMVPTSKGSKQEPSDTESLSKYQMFNNDVDNRRNVVSSQRNNRSRSRSSSGGGHRHRHYRRRRTRRRQRRRSSSYRFRSSHRSDSEDESDSMDSEDDDDDKDSNSRSVSSQDDSQDDSDKNDDDSDDYRHRRYRHRRRDFSSTAGINSNSNHRNHHHSNNNNNNSGSSNNYGNSNDNGRTRSFNSHHRQSTVSSSSSNNHLRNIRQNRYHHRSSNDHHGSKYYHYQQYSSNNPTSTTTAGATSSSSSNIYQQGINNLQHSAFFAAINEPYNPEDAIFNQSQLMSFRPSNMVPNMMVNLNHNTNQNNKLRHRQLVNVSLVTNDDANIMNDDQQQNYHNNNINNIELTRNTTTIHGPQQSNQGQPYNNMNQRRNQQRFDSKNSNHQKNQNRTSTLLIQKIPVHQNRIDLLNDHFQKFGSILNIKVGGGGTVGDELDPESALIQYSSPIEANRAYRSTEPVLNNRFIKVFWTNREQSTIFEKKQINNSVPSVSTTIDNVGSSNNNNRSFIDNCLPAKRKFSNAGRDQSQQDLRVEITNSILKKFKSPTSLDVQPTTPSHQQQPLPIVRKVLFGSAKKRQLMLMQQYRQQSNELNRKLEELFCNQRHLIAKLKQLKQPASNDSKQQQNLKKLIQSNMERIEEIQKKLIQLQQSIKTNRAVVGSVSSTFINRQTSRIYNKTTAKTQNSMNNNDKNNVDPIESTTATTGDNHHVVINHDVDDSIDDQRESSNKQKPNMIEDDDENKDDDQEVEE